MDRHTAGDRVERAIESNVESLWIDAEFGGRLRVVQAGSGRVVMFVPGWTMSWTVFEHQISFLSRSMRALALDPRSQGESTFTVDGNSYTQHGRDIEAVLNAFDLGRVDLVGWSFGSLACLAFLHRAGFDRVEHLAIVDQAPRPFACDPASTWCDGDWAHFKREMIGPLATDRRAFGEDFIDWATSVSLTGTDREWLIKMHTATPSAAATALVMDAVFSDYTSVAEAADTALSVLYVVRDDDLEAAVPWLRAHSPRARVESMPSHLGFWEEADAFNNVLFDFLNAPRS